MLMKNFENWFSETFIERNHMMIEWDDGEQHIVGEKEKVKALCKWAWDAGIASIVAEEKEGSCSNCGCEMPEGCNGLFVKDGDACQLNAKQKSALVFVGNGA